MKNLYIIILAPQAPKIFSIKIQYIEIFHRNSSKYKAKITPKRHTSPKKSACGGLSTMGLYKWV